MEGLIIPTLTLTLGMLKALSFLDEELETSSLSIIQEHWVMNMTFHWNPAPRYNMNICCCVLSCFFRYTSNNNVYCLKEDYRKIQFIIQMTFSNRTLCAPDGTVVDPLLCFTTTEKNAFLSIFSALNNICII